MSPPRGLGIITDGVAAVMVVAAARSFKRFRIFSRLMRIRRRTPLPFVLVVALSTVSLAQQRPEDRRRFMEPGTATTDDPRRVPIPAGERGPEGVTVLQGGRIFDGTGSPVRNGTLLLERNRIRAILAPTDRSWPQDAQVFDVSGLTVLPGLIDLHTHIDYSEPDVPIEQAVNPTHAVLRGVERLRYYIESGITSVRDTGSKYDVPFRLKEFVSENRIPGPRVFAAGRVITATGGHGAEGLSPHSQIYGEIREASGPDDWREAVREQFKNGADFIKLASHYSKEEVAAAIDEAHTLGLRVTVDAETFYIGWAVEAGVDCVEHPLPRTDEVIQMMAARKVYSVPTLQPYSYIFDLAGGYFGSTSRRFSFSKEANLDVLKRMKKAGVEMGVGTDLVMDWFRYLPKPYIHELEWFVAGGYSIPEALVAATHDNAEILGMLDKLGTLEPGKLADVLVVRGRPDEDLSALENVELVFRDGYLQVRDGRVFIRRHVPRTEPRPGGSGEWR
jgi:imidazolonepropionase-like amidohydrolase